MPDRAVVDRHELFAELERWGLTPGQICVIWPIVSRFVEQFIVGRSGLLPVQPEDLAKQWREVTHA